MHDAGQVTDNQRKDTFGLRPSHRRLVLTRPENEVCCPEYHQLREYSPISDVIKGGVMDYDSPRIDYNDIMISLSLWLCIRPPLPSPRCRLIPIAKSAVTCHVDETGTGI
jgi:hypothetical protein